METPAPLLARQLARLEPCAVPVLRASASALARSAQRPDEADASRLADIALRDPLLCLRVLQHVAAAFGPRLRTPVQTVTGALVLLGIEPFFRAFTGLPVLEERTAAHPGATAAALACITRAHAAARIATAFGVHRQDDDVELLHQAALLHDFAELLLWCEAPREAAALKALRQHDPAAAGVGRRGAGDEHAVALRDVEEHRAAVHGGGIARLLADVLLARSGTEGGRARSAEGRGAAA